MKKKKLNVSDLFSIFISNQATFDEGAQDMADLQNTVLEFYIEKNCTPLERDRIHQGMLMYIDGEPLQDVWSYVDPHFND